ncbi:MAG TPA: polyprenol monophosphomannose synthase [bacterium]|nr:polyprenol monophosphomannose synthase [bacterium]
MVGDGVETGSTRAGPREAPAATVVVPTYNERDTIAELLRRVARAAAGGLSACEVLVVDDSSPDGTGQVAAGVAAELQDVLSILVITRPGKSGLASAVLEGVRRAQGHVIVVMDSDLSHPPETVPALLGAVAGGADIAVGSRYVRGGGVRRWPWRRRMMSRGATWLARAVLGVRAADPMSGFFAARRGLFDDAPIVGLGYKILLELIVRHPAAAVVEVPYVFSERAGGRSKLNAGEVLNYLRLLIRLRVRSAGGGAATP